MKKLTLFGLFCLCFVSIYFLCKIISNKKNKNKKLLLSTSHEMTKKRFFQKIKKQKVCATCVFCTEKIFFHFFQNKLTKIEKISQSVLFFISYFFFFSFSSSSRSL